MTVDDRGFPLELAQPPQRIVSLVPSLTETLVDLGVEDRIVGVTKFCLHPDHLRREKTRVGGTKGVRVDLILDLQPDLVIANLEENDAGRDGLGNRGGALLGVRRPDCGAGLPLLADLGELVGAGERAVP